MSSKNRRRLFRRIDFRITAWFSLVFAVGALALFVATYFTLYQSLRSDDLDELRHQLIQHWSAFSSTVDENEAVNKLAEALRTSSSALGRPLFFRLATVDNVTIFQGGLTEWTQGFALDRLAEPQRPSTGTLLTIRSSSLSYGLEIMGIQLSDTLVLQLGLSTAERERFLEHFQGRFLGIFAVIMAVAIAGGVFFTSRMLAPVVRLNDAIGRIVQTGDLESRLDYQPGNSDLQEMVGTFNQMLDRIQAVVGAMRDALDAVAHDLRTPMTRFRNVAEAALSQPHEPAVYREALSDAMEESEEILTMLNAMMDISEAQSGVLTLHAERIDLGGLLRQVADVYEFVADEATMQINLQVDDTIALDADPVRIRQVVGNLLDNAIKYGNPGSTIDLRAVATERAEAMIAVRNEGRGIDPESRERIWERLYRGPDTAATQGVGLGLTLVRAIVEAHHGRVEAASEPGEYAEFRVYLPLPNISEL